MGNKEKKGRLDIYMALGGSSFLMGPTTILVHMAAALGVVPDNPTRIQHKYFLHFAPLMLDF